MAQGGSLYELAEGRYGDVMISTLDTSEFYMTQGDDYGYYNVSGSNETNGKAYARKVVYNKAEMACNVIKVGTNTVKTLIINSKYFTPNRLIFRLSLTSILPLLWRWPQRECINDYWITLKEKETEKYSNN